MGLGLPAVDVMCHHSSADVSCAGRNGAQEHQRFSRPVPWSWLGSTRMNSLFFQKKKKIIAERWKNEFGLSPALLMTSQEKVKFAL